MADRRSLTLQDLETLLKEEDGLLTPVNTEMGSGIVDTGGQEVEENSIQARLRRLEESGRGVTRYKDTASAGEQVLDFLGEGLWGVGESASFGVLDVATLTKPGKAVRKVGSLGRHKEWDESTFAGNAGYIVGSGIGMLVPLTGWMSGLRFLTRAGRGLTSASKILRSSSIAEKLASKYALKKGAAQMQKTIANLGDDAMQGIIRESDEILGFSSRNPFIAKRFKDITKSNVRALDDATAGMKNSIKKFAPELSEIENAELATDLMEVMLKHDPGDIHRILAKMPGIRALGPRKQQMAVAAASNFTTGLIFHTGNEAMGNLTFAAINAAGLDVDEKASKMHPGLWKNKDGISAFLKDASMSGLGFAAIAPAHFVRGGRQIGPRKEAWTGLKNMVRSLKPIKGLDDAQALARVRLMESAALNHGGISLRNFVKHDAMNTPNWINTLTGAQAKSILFQTRKQFAAEWLPYIGKEITKDLYGSLPRMITGSMLMQLPHLIHSKGDIGDPGEFATHVLTGMFFAKKGQIFKQGRKLGWGGENIWQTTQKPEAYTATPKRAKAIHAAMTYMGMDIDVPMNRESLPKSILRSAMEETGEWRYIKEIVKDYYTEDVKDIPGAKDIETAYREKVAKMGEEMTPHKEQKLQNALKILKSFDSLGPRKNEAFRDVTAEEAYDIVESVNKAPNVGSSRNNIDAWLQHVEGKTLSIAAQRYIDPVVKFLAHTLDTLGLRYTIDENTNKITMPKVNIDKVINNLLPGAKRTALAQMAEAFNYQVAEGVKDGVVQLDTTKEVTSLNKDQHRSLLEGLDAAVLNLNQQASGVDITSVSGFFDADIMTNADMRFMYREIKGAEQRNNFLASFAPAGQESGMYNTMSDKIKGDVNSNIESLRLDRPVKFIMTEGQNPENQRNVISTYNKLRELYSRINGKYEDGAAQPITISEVSSKLDNLFGPAQERMNPETKEMEIHREGGIFGDIITNDKAYNELLKSVTGEFMNRLGIEDATNGQSIMSGLTYLINGSIMEKSGSSGTAIVDPGGKFARTSPRGVILPESVSLFKAIKPHLTPEQIAEIMPIAEWYDTMQVGLEAAGGLVKFSANTENIQKIIQSYGVDGIIQFLRNAKGFSDLGKIENLIEAPIKLQDSIDGLDKIDAILNSHLEDGTVDAHVIDALKPQLRDLFHSLSSLRNSFDVARIEKNMPWLLAIEGTQNNYSNMEKNVQEFLRIDASVEGNITTEYVKIVAKLAMEAAEISRIQTGEVNLENYRNVIQAEINSESKNLPDKQHFMEINISPQKFQTKYAMFPHVMEKIMKNAYESYHNPGGGGLVEVMKAFDNIIQSANESSTGAGIKINQADLITDSIQMIGNRVFRKKIKTLQIKNNLGEHGEAFIVPDKRLGLDGLNNMLDLNNDYYQMSKEVITTDALGINRKAPLNEANESLIDANMQKGLGMDNPRNENLVIQQAEGVEVEMYPTRKLIRVVFGEVSAAYPIVETKLKIQNAYKKDGVMYEALMDILDGSEGGAARIKELSKRFTSDMTVDDIKDAINYTWTVLNMPHIVLETAATMDYTQSLDAIKRRKMTHIDRGKVLNQDYYDFLLHSYERGSIHSPIFVQMHDLLKSVAPDGDISSKRQRFIPIHDEAGTLTIKSIAERVYKRYVEEGLMSENEARDAVAEIDADVSAVNSATFLTQKAFNIELAKMGARPEWFMDGDINLSKVGALKPKGVHVSVDKNGRMVVFYNKTAMFYDKEIAGYLEAEGMDGAVFKSGNKINKYRGAKGQVVISKMTEPSAYEGGSIGEIIKERIVQGNKDGSYLDLPYDTHVTNNLSREHPGTVGSNTGIHFPHSVGIDEWMNAPERIRQFKDLLIAAKNSEYAAAHILEQLLMKGRDAGDAQYDRLPYEVMLQESGIILQPHLQDVAFDRLFKFFFEGGKIATNSVPNSSYNAMMPDVTTRLDIMDLPVRNGGSQRLLGGYVASDFDLSSIYKKFGVTTPDNRLQHTGSTLSTRIRYSDPANNMEIKEADIIVLPDGKKLTYIIDGWFIDGDTAIDLAYRGRGKNKAEVIETAKMIAPGILEVIAKDYTKAMDDIGPESTYRDVLDMLSENWDIVNAQSRQPRNSMNDFLLTKIKGARDRGDGNASAANVVDVLRTQDADHDFDKSSSYQSAPKDVYKHAAANGGLKTSLDSYTWADEMVHKINVTMENDKNLNSSLRKWMLNHENAELIRGQFVKLHNVATYILNAFPNNGVVAKYTIGNQTYEIRSKTDSAYYRSVDEVSHWVKLFIDSYKKTMSVDTMGEIIDDLMLGSKQPIDDGGTRRRFNGFFEIVSKGKGGVETSNPIEDPAIRDIIKYNYLVPLKRYLRYNRGESIDPEALGGLKIEDIANGYSDFMFDIGVFGKNQELFISNKDKTGDRRESIDLSMGMKRLRHYITKESQNPFDRAMKQLYEIRNESESPRTSDNLSLTQGILLKAEKGLLKVNEKGVEADPWEVLSVHSQRLWNHVQKDHDYALYMSAARRLKNLKDTQQYFVAEPREVNAKKMADLEKKILFYEELMADAEIRIGAEFARREGRPSWSPAETIQRESFTARTEPIVVWTKDGKIKEVIRVGRANQEPIYKTDMMIQGGKRFEMVDAKQQTYLKSRSLAFNDLPFIDIGKDGRLELDSGQQAVLQSALFKFRDQLQIHKDDLKAKRISPGEYVTRAQGELHRILNGHYRSGIDSELMRKGMIWQMLAPSINTDVVVSQKGPDGKYIYDSKYYENAMETKVVEGYLMGVGTGEKFSQQNTMNHLEAAKLMKEIASRTALSHLALSKPEMEVVLDLGIQGQDWYKQQNMKDVTPNIDIYKSNRMVEVGHEESMGMINDFIGQGKLISPGDMHKLGYIISKNTGVPMGEILSQQSFSQKRHFGNYGEAPTKAETHDSGLKRILERYKKGCEK